MATSETSRKFKFPKEILLFVVIFVVTFGVFYVIASSRGGGVTLPFAALPTATPTPEPTAVPPTPTPTVEVKRSDVKIKILNGTGVAGQAGGVKTMLEGKGYTDITTGNADRYDYATSEVQIAKDKAPLKDVILDDIKSSIVSPTLTDMGEGETVDVIIVIGKDVN